MQCLLAVHVVTHTAIMPARVAIGAMVIVGVIAPWCHIKARTKEDSIIFRTGIGVNAPGCGNSEETPVDARGHLLPRVGPEHFLSCNSLSQRFHIDISTWHNVHVHAHNSAKNHDSVWHGTSFLAG